MCTGWVRIFVVWAAERIFCINQYKKRVELHIISKIKRNFAPF